MCTNYITPAEINKWAGKIAHMETTQALIDKIYKLVLEELETTAGKARIPVDVIIKKEEEKNKDIFANFWESILLEESEENMSKEESKERKELKTIIAITDIIIRKISKKYNIKNRYLRFVICVDNKINSIASKTNSNKDIQEEEMNCVPNERKVANF